MFSDGLFNYLLLSKLLQSRDFFYKATHNDNFSKQILSLRTTTRFSGVKKCYENMILKQYFASCKVLEHAACPVYEINYPTL